MQQAAQALGSDSLLKVTRYPCRCGIPADQFLHAHLTELRRRAGATSAASTPSSKRPARPTRAPQAGPCLPSARVLQQPTSRRQRAWQSWGCEHRRRAPVLGTRAIPGARAGQSVAAAPWLTRRCRHHCRRRRPERLRPGCLHPARPRSSPLPARLERRSWRVTRRGRHRCRHLATRCPPTRLPRWWRPRAPLALALPLRMGGRGLLQAPLQLLPQPPPQTPLPTGLG